MPQGDNLIVWGRHTPSATAIKHNRLYCALLDIISSPGLSDRTYAAGPYFPTTREEVEPDRFNEITKQSVEYSKVCYWRNLTASSGLLDLLRIYNLSTFVPDPANSLAAIEIRSWREITTTGEIHYCISAQIQILDREGKPVKVRVEDERRDLVTVYGASWVGGGVGHGEDVSEGLSWRFMAAFLKEHVAVAFDDEGDKTSEAIQRFKILRRWDRFVELGYRGFPGLWLEEMGTGQRVGAFRRA